MIHIIYQILGVILLFVKKFPVTGKRELHRPQTYIASSVIFIIQVIIFDIQEYFGHQLDTHALIIIGAVGLVPTLIALFLLSRPKGSS